MEQAEKKVIPVGMEGSHRILTAMVAATSGEKTLDCEECGRAFIPNEDETPYCEPCLAQAERELDEANSRAHAYPKFEEWDGKGSGGLFVKEGELVMLDRKGREITTIYRSRKALAKVAPVNRGGEAARRQRQQARLEEKRRARKAAM